MLYDRNTFFAMWMGVNMVSIREYQEQNVIRGASIQDQTRMVSKLL